MTTIAPSDDQLCQVMEIAEAIADLPRCPLSGRKGPQADIRRQLVKSLDENSAGDKPVLCPATNFLRPTGPKFLILTGIKVVSSAMAG
jgi:hypothetical protein